LRQIRELRGEMGWDAKVGFTNRTAWAEYGPIWGYVYNRTVHNLAEIGDTFSGQTAHGGDPDDVFLAN
jgi:2-oxo-3-hexenedioate decarboxylase